MSRCPCSRRLGLALAWIETKRSAPSALARAVRSSSGSVASRARVSTTSAPSRSRRSRARRARCRASRLLDREALRARIVAAVPGIEHDLRPAACLRARRAARASGARGDGAAVARRAGAGRSPCRAGAGGGRGSARPLSRGRASASTPILGSAPSTSMTTRGRSDSSSPIRARSDRPVGGPVGAAPGLIGRTGRQVDVDAHERSAALVAHVAHARRRRAREVDHDGDTVGHAGRAQREYRRATPRPATAKRCRTPRVRPPSAAPQPPLPTTARRIRDRPRVDQGERRARPTSSDRIAIASTGVMRSGSSPPSSRRSCSSAGRKERELARRGRGRRPPRAVAHPVPLLEPRQQLPRPAD